MLTASSNFSELLRQARLKSHFSQSQLALKMKVSRLTIHRWERGVSVPSSKFWRDLSIFLNCQVEMFLLPDHLSHKVTPNHERMQEEKNFNAVSSPLLDRTSMDQICISQLNPSIRSFSPSTREALSSSLVEGQKQTEHQWLIVAEQCVELHRRHVRDGAELSQMMLVLLDAGTTEDFRLRMRELLFSQIEQIRQEVNDERAFFSFLQIKDAFDLAKQEETQALRFRNMSSQQ